MYSIYAGSAACAGTGGIGSAQAALKPGMLKEVFAIKFYSEGAVFDW
jgi:hypothetical protein